MTTINQTRSLLVFIENHTAISLIASGANIWQQDKDKTLLSFRNCYLQKIAAIPTNTQFTERGVKESDYVSLGRRCEKKNVQFL